MRYQQSRDAELLLDEDSHQGNRSILWAKPFYFKESLGVAARKERGALVFSSGCGHRIALLRANERHFRAKEIKSNTRKFMFLFVGQATGPPHKITTTSGH
jgi:hypothetical protein